MRAPSDHRHAWGPRCEPQYQLIAHPAFFRLVVLFEERSTKLDPTHAASSRRLFPVGGAAPTRSCLLYEVATGLNDFLRRWTGHSPVVLVRAATKHRDKFGTSFPSPPDLSSANGTPEQTRLRRRARLQLKQRAGTFIAQGLPWKQWSHLKHVLPLEPVRRDIASGVIVLCTTGTTGSRMALGKLYPLNVQERILRHATAVGPPPYVH